MYIILCVNPFSIFTKKNDLHYVAIQNEPFFAMRQMLTRFATAISGSESCALAPDYVENVEILYLVLTVGAEHLKSIKCR